MILHSYRFLKRTTPLLCALLLNACVVVNRPTPIIVHYVDIPCELPSGVPSTCRIVENSFLQPAYWENGSWHNTFVVPRFWLFKKVRYH